MALLPCQKKNCSPTTCCHHMLLQQLTTEPKSRQSLSAQGDGAMGSLPAHTNKLGQMGQMFLPWRAPNLSTLVDCCQSHTAALSLRGGGAPRRSFGVKWSPASSLCCSATGDVSQPAKGLWHLLQHLWCHRQLTRHKTVVKRALFPTDPRLWRRVLLHQAAEITNWMTAFKEWFYNLS